MLVVFERGQGGKKRRSSVHTRFGLDFLKQGVAWTRRAATEPEGSVCWIELGPSRRSRWQTRCSNEYRERLAHQSGKTVNKCAIIIDVGLGAFGAAAVTPMVVTRAGNEERRKKREEQFQTRIVKLTQCMRRLPNALGPISWREHISNSPGSSQFTCI